MELKYRSFHIKLWVIFLLTFRSQFFIHRLIAQKHSNTSFCKERNKYILVEAGSATYCVLNSVLNLKCYQNRKGPGIAQSVFVFTTDWTTGIRSAPESKDFSSSLCMQTSSEAHPVSYPMGTRGPFPGGKARPGRDSDHSLPSSVEVKNELELYFLSPFATAWQ
jgi:hypothetical protein